MREAALGPTQPRASLRVRFIGAKKGTASPASVRVPDVVIARHRGRGRRGVLTEPAHSTRRMGRRARDASSARLRPDPAPRESWDPLIRVRRGEGV
eukprot:5233005-Heterocapsa_arctica.AAC.1